MKRKISIFLAVILALGIVGCGTDNSRTDDTSVSDTTTAPPETEPPVVYDPYEDLPTGDYGGATVTMFVRAENSSTPEFYAEQTGEIVDDSIYERNRIVSERLGVTFEFVENPCNFDYRNIWAQKLTNSILSNEQAYDIAAGYSMAIATVATQGLLSDLASLENLNFSKPWWSESLLNDSMVNGKLFFASGDIATWMILNTYGMAFNKDMVEDFKLTSPYTLVYEGKWTLDSMFELSKGIYADLDNNQTKSPDDRFGFATGPVFVDCLYQAAGLRTTDIVDGKVILSPDFSSERANDLIAKLTTFLHGGNDGYVLNGIAYNFDKGNSVFTLMELIYAYTTLRDVDFDYGILPVPKFDEEQENYNTVASFPYTLYAIPLDAKDPELAAAVMECLAGEGHRHVTPALFEVALKVKYSQDDNDARMYDIIRESVIFDIGRVFSDNLGAFSWSYFRTAINENQTEWMSTVAEISDGIKSTITKLFDELGEQ